MNSWSFGTDNDYLIKLVLQGKKTATTSLYGVDKLPTIGEESMICFDNEKDACIVKTKSYKVMKFNEMTEDLAKLEGEGDLSLDYWKKTHYDYFKSIDPSFNEDSLIIFEEFFLIKTLFEEKEETIKKYVL